MSQQTAIEKDAPKRTTLADFLSNTLAQSMAAALPKHLTAERMTRVCLTALRTTKDLASCTQASFAGEIMKLAQLGLEPNTPLGHAYLIPRRNTRKGVIECTTIIGYQGYIDLALRSGRVDSIYAHVVYEGDDFDFELGLHPKLRHVPKGASNVITHAYAVARVKDGEPVFEVLPLGRIEERRKRGGSGGGSSSPWDTDYAAMARKSAIRAIWYALPKSSEMALVAEYDSESDRYVAQSNASAVSAIGALNQAVLGSGDPIDVEAEDDAEAAAIRAEAGGEV